MNTMTLDSRRRITALNFLSNISLDGSRQNTNYSGFLNKVSDSKPASSNEDYFEENFLKPGKNNTLQCSATSLKSGFAAPKSASNRELKDNSFEKQG